MKPNELRIKKLAIFFIILLCINSVESVEKQVRYKIKKDKMVLD